MIAKKGKNMDDDEVVAHSHHVKDKWNDGADDNQGVHQVPNVTQIGTRVGNDSQVDDLKYVTNHVWVEQLSRLPITDIIRKFD